MFGEIVLISLVLIFSLSFKDCLGCVGFTRVILMKAIEIRNEERHRLGYVWFLKSNKEKKKMLK